MSDVENIDPKISVIVPVYKVEQYLDRCVKSILSQTFTNFELVLVDDGSPDKSGLMCDEWSKNDSRIKVIHKENGGLSDARNTGVEKASAEYVTFIDSDDYVAEDFLEYLYKLITENNCDVSACYFCKTYGESVWNYGEDGSHIYNNIQACKLSFSDVSIGIAVGKLYKKELLQQYTFPVGRFHEDTATVGKILYQVKAIAVGEKRLYAYFQNPDSITHSPSLKQRSDQLWSVVEIANFFTEHIENAVMPAAWKQVGYVLYTQLRAGFFDSENLNEYLKSYLRNESLFSFLRLKVVCALHFPNAIAFWGKCKKFLTT